MTASTCWGYGIHESDSALDWEFALRKVAGAADRAVTPDERQRQQVKLERGLPTMLTLLQEEAALPESGEAYIAQGHQVLASLLMDAGCAFPEEVRSLLVAGIEACPEFTMAQILKAGKDQPIDVLRVAHLFADHGRLGPQGTADRLNGRFLAIESLLKNLREYDLTGSHPVMLLQPRQPLYATPAHG